MCQTLNLLLLMYALCITGNYNDFCNYSIFASLFFIVNVIDSCACFIAGDLQLYVTPQNIFE